MTYMEQMQETARHLPEDVAQVGRKMMLAGVGAAGVIGNTTSTLFDTLVEEGKRLQKVEMETVDRFVSKTTHTVNDAVNDAMAYVQDGVQQVTKAALNRLGMPSRRDVADLATRVEVLTAKVEALSRKGATHVD